MWQTDIENLLQQSMGLDTASIGRAAIERAVGQRMVQQGAGRIEDYWRQLRSSPDELQELIEVVVVPETWFFRHREAFGALSRFVQHEWLSAHSASVLRVLSVPCSTGEEPYSIAMALLDNGLAPERFTIEAWDISRRALAQAERGSYTRNSFRGDDLAFRDRYFQCGGDSCQVSDAVRRQVSFHHSNLLAPQQAAGAARYDVIFCRNVLIYFDRSTQDTVMTTLKQLLTHDGMAFVGPAEALLMRGAGFAATEDLMAFAFRAGATRLQVQTPSPQPRRPAVSRPAAKATIPVRAARPSSPAPQAGTPPAADLDAARRLADSGHLDEAAHACETYLRQHGDCAGAHYLMGLIADTQGNMAKAAQSYRKALYLEPGHTEALIHLALLAERQGDIVEARRLHERARRAAKSAETANP